MKRVLGISLAVALSSALLVVPFAAAEVVERVRLMEAGRTLTAGLPPGVFLLLVSPPGYERSENSGSKGSWVGPDYRATRQPELRGRTSIEWELRFDNQSKNSEDAARAGLDRRWEQTVKGGISVPHVVDGRDVGTFDGDFVLTVGPASADASYEAAMAFPIAPRLFAVVRFFVTGPAGRSTGSFGEYVVMDTVGVSTWNRGQAFRSMAGIRIQGNLPPTRLFVRGGAGRVDRRREDPRPG